MTARRLKGYVVKLPDGTRSPRTPKPVTLYRAGVAWDRDPTTHGSYVVPVFAASKSKPSLGDLFKASLDASKPKPKPAPAIDAELGAHEEFGHWEGAKPAPVVAAEGRYALLADGPHFFVGWGDVLRQRFVGGREEVRLAARHYRTAAVVRILADGEHEVACESARREEREHVKDAIKAALRASIAAADKGSDKLTRRDAIALLGMRSYAATFLESIDKTVDAEEKGQAK